MADFKEISDAIQIGDASGIKQLCVKAMEDNNPKDILEQGLLVGMDIIGGKFKNNEIFVPEVLMAARAMTSALEILKPEMLKNNEKEMGKVVIGTIKGDLHDIGKNLVKIMMQGKGITVIDLGNDVSPEKFIKTAVDENAEIIACSALLTTTMAGMANVVKGAEEAGIRDKVKIMVGGAPISKEFCDKIGADIYTADAATAADEAYKVLKNTVRV
jgi:corrinoid protein of di/trimethylamine methyltransferase